MAGDLEPEPLCSIGVSSWSARGAEAGFDVIASGTQRSRQWRPSTQEDAVGGLQPTSQRRQSRSQLLLQQDTRELGLHEIEFVSDQCEVGARLIEMTQF